MVLLGPFTSALDLSEPVSYLIMNIAGEGICCTSGLFLKHTLRLPGFGF